MPQASIQPETIYNTLRVRRSQPLSIYSTSGDGKTQSTYLDAIAGGQSFFRTDIVLVNLERRHCATCECRNDVLSRQVHVYVRRDGTLVGGGLAWLTTEDLEWAEAEAQRMLAVLAEYPQWSVMFA